MDGSEDAFDACRVEEEPDLSRRGGRLALAARRQVHRDRRALQPADRSVDDRARRAEGKGLARQGRAPLRRRAETLESEKHLLVIAELLEYVARQLVDEPDAVRVDQVDENDELVL